MENRMVQARLTRLWRAHGAPETLGFTLMELLIVMVIIGILTAIALPNYSEYIARGNRTDGKALLLQIAQWEERARTETNSYQAPPGTMLASPGNGTKYTITPSNVAAGTYTLTAAPAA